MINGFKYKDRNFYIGAMRMNCSKYVTFTLYDLDKIEKCKIDFTEKELAKIEIMECLKELTDGDEISNSIISQRQVLLTEFCKDYDVFSKLKKDLLTDIDNA